MRVRGRMRRARACRSSELRSGLVVETAGFVVISVAEVLRCAQDDRDKMNEMLAGFPVLVIR
jgi:hypothetical protein